MTTNIGANININVGGISTEQTLFQVNIYNSHSKTQQISNEINGSTGVTPHNNQVWIFVQGQNAADLKSKAEELGFLGSPSTYGSGNGAWALIDLQGLRDQGMPVPPIGEIPFVGQALPGNSHIEFKVSSSTTFDQATALQEQEGFAAVAAFFQNFNLNLNLHGDSATLDAGLEILSQVVGQKKSEGIKAFCGALTDANLSLTFSDWRQLSPEFQETLKKPSLKSILKGEFAGILAGVGDLFEQEFRVIFVVNDASFVEVKVKGPGLVNWAMSSMDQ